MTQPDLVWSDERPTESGNYWLSVHPAKRKRRKRPGVFSPSSGDWPSVLSVTVEHCAELNAYYVFGENDGICELTSGWLKGAKWAKHSLPFDPFAAHHPSSMDL